MLFSETNKCHYNKACWSICSTFETVHFYVFMSEGIGMSETSYIKKKPNSMITF